MMSRPTTRTSQATPPTAIHPVNHHPHGDDMANDFSAVKKWKQANA